MAEESPFNNSPIFTFVPPSAPPFQFGENTTSSTSSFQFGNTSSSPVTFSNPLNFGSSGTSQRSVFNSNPTTTTFATPPNVFSTGFANSSRPMSMGFTHTHPHTRLDLHSERFFQPSRNTSIWPPEVLMPIPRRTNSNLGLDNGGNETTIKFSVPVFGEDETTLNGVTFVTSFTNSRVVVKVIKEGDNAVEAVSRDPWDNCNAVFSNTKPFNSSIFANESNWNVNDGNPFRINRHSPVIFGSSMDTSTLRSALKQPAVQFNPVRGTDTVFKNGLNANINVKHQCITVMKEYEDKSLEELRMDYASKSQKCEINNTKKMVRFGGDVKSRENSVIAKFNLVQHNGPKIISFNGVTYTISLMHPFITIRAKKTDFNSESSDELKMEYYGSSRRGFLSSFFEDTTFMTTIQNSPNERRFFRRCRRRSSVRSN